jgi:hypothetical protein
LTGDLQIRNEGTVQPCYESKNEKQNADNYNLRSVVWFTRKVWSHAKILKIENVFSENREITVKIHQIKV